jgi:hypothetical protein
MKPITQLQLGWCLTCLILLSPLSASGQCELIKRDIENVRSTAVEVLQLTDTLEVFVSAVGRTKQYQTARSNTRKAQIYSGEILAAAYRAVARAAEARKRAENCGAVDVDRYLSNAAVHAERVKNMADQAFGYSKRAYASRSLAGMQNYLQKALDAIHQAESAASATADAASEAHFCTSQEVLVAAGKGP